MNQCKKCLKEYDPSEDFIEEIELLESLMRYLNVEEFCSDCLYDIDNQIEDMLLYYIGS